jgi:hypothetical protein
MPAKAGIQQGTGYFFVFEKVACPLSGAGFRLALAIASVAGMTPNSTDFGNTTLELR